ncbi:hypothetical protein CPR19088_GLDEOEPO_00806 [Companilactobacillus paralimentarius]
MKNIKLKYILFVMSLVTAIGMAVKFSTVQVEALPTTDEVYTNAPDGLNLTNLLDIKEYNGGPNSASLITNYPVNIIELLNENKGNSQIGSFWGRKYSDDSETKLYNSFRTDKPQTISAWIYFGDTYHLYPDLTGKTNKDSYNDAMSTNKTSDGIALVLQDDSRGASAVSTAIGGSGKGNPSYGETLGVWAGTTVDHSPITGATSLSATAYDNLYTTGIQNSFALEMDTLQNYKKPTASGLFDYTGQDDYFDNLFDIKGQHIVGGYPGSQDTYKVSSETYGGLLSGGRYYYSELTKLGVPLNNIDISGYGIATPKDVDHAWKHFTFYYYPPTSDTSNTASYKYRFNDQNIDGTAAVFNVMDRGSGTIDLSKIGAQSKNIRWGFTASTGSQYSAPKTYSMIMQQMPNTANIESSSKLLDMSQYGSDSMLGREIKDLGENSSFRPDSASPIGEFISKSDYNVSNNDTLLFQYDLNYDSGTLNTGEITTQIHLPKNVNFKTGLSDTVGSGSIGKVVYSGNGSDSSKSFEFSAADITSDAKSGDSVINMKLADMDTENQHATIYLYGQANAATTPLLVRGEPTSLHSDHYISDITSANFIINDQLNIASDTTEQTVNSDEDVKLTGTLNYAGNSTFDGKAVEMHTKINGTEIPSGEAVATSGSKTGTYTMISSSAISSGSPLKIGKNTIEVYAVDSLNRTSNKIVYTINVKDYKDFVLSATGDNPQTVKVTDPITLTNDSSYSNGDPVQLGDLSGYYKVDDDQSYTKIFPSGGSATGPVAHLNFRLPAGTLTPGTHTIKFYLTDLDSRNSNEIEYTINVVDKKLQLTATGEDPQTVQITDPFTLTSEATYSDGDAVQAKDLQAYIQIDNSTKYVQTTVKGDGTSNQPAKLSIELPEGLLRVGPHTIKVYMSDSDRNSNEVTYNINIINRTLTLTPTETDLNQTVHDNSNVKLGGSYAYSDNSDFANAITSVKYQITNADGNQQAEVTQDVTKEVTNTGEFTIELEPIGADLFDNNSQQSVDDYLKTATGLKVGRNEIKVTAYDGTTASQTSATYVVNVPDITPTIEATKSELMAISNLPVRLPMTFTYPDVDAMAYLLQAKDLAVFAQVDGSTDTPVMTVADRPKETDKQISTPYKLDPKSTWTDETATGNYNLKAYVMDRYLRKTNTVDYTVKVLPNGAQVEVENYRFKTIDPQGKLVPKYVQRDGNWNIKVDSYKSKWQLQAQADNMKRQDENGNYSELSNLQMVDLDEKSGMPISLSENPVIATGDSTNLADPVSYSLFDENADPNAGIMLGTRGVPLSGEYQGIVTWSLSDAV